MKIISSGWMVSFVLFLAFTGFTQPAAYTPAQLHAHNDYEKPFPFWAAWHAGAGSIEVDIYLQHGKLMVAHLPIEIQPHRTLQAMYLSPIDSLLLTHNGMLAKDSSRELQLLIDIKTVATPTLAALTQLMAQYPAITQSKQMQVVISGNRPHPAQFGQYPAWMLFDGRPGETYTKELSIRVPLVSDNFQKYSRWNGKGIIPAGEKQRIDSLVSAVHAQGKRIRFWATPDTLNAWYQMIHLKVDYINTDFVADAALFLRTLGKRSYKANGAAYPLYNPTYASDGSAAIPKNVILLIGDGMGMAQLYAGYTGNYGALNLFGMRHTGHIKTSSYDSYITDSAPGSTAFSSGQKTNNRSVGIDHTGRALTLLPALLARQGKKTGIISSGDFTDATPADFYAHQAERSSSMAIADDLQRAPIDLIMAAPSMEIDRFLDSQLTAYRLIRRLEDVGTYKGEKLAIIDRRAGLSMPRGRKDWLGRAFTISTELLGSHPGGFFFMAEGAQIDYAGHANDLPYLVQEVHDFDQLVARALQFADQNGETLVIVTADHETGGLTLTDGDYLTGYVSGQFATTDHTAAPVPVFAYGPQAQRFTGVYENTDIFYRIIVALGVGTDSYQD